MFFKYSSAKFHSNKMGPTEGKCFSKCGVVIDKRKFTSSRNNSRKCDEIRDKTLFKDVYNDNFSESTAAKSLDLFQLKEAPMATQLGASSHVPKAEDNSNYYPSSGVYCVNTNNAQKRFTKENYYNMNRISEVEMTIGKQEHSGIDIGKHKKKNDQRMVISTQMQQRIKTMTLFNNKIIFLAIFFLVCSEASGTHVEQSLDKMAVQHQSRLMRNKRDSHISSEGTFSAAYDGVYDSNFPTPVVENVYKAWKPVSYGHPLKDATMFYAPPSLERVVISGGLDTNTGNNIDRSDRGPQSRSLNGDQRSHFDNNYTPPAKPNVVIAAEPQKNYGSKGYSIYGSPDINYSKLYDQPPVKLPTHETPKPNGREEPYLIFQRDYFNSAKGSRAADDGKFEQQLLLSPQLAKLARKDPRFSDRNRPLGPKVDLGGGGGGIKYIDPPNRKSNDYFYYSENHPRYNKNANLLKSPNKDEKTVKHPYNFDKGPRQNPKGVEIQIGEHRGNAGGIDRTEIIVNPQHNNVDIITAEDLVGRDSVKSYSNPSENSRKDSSLINVYSFTNKHGQKEKVGIIYDQSSLSSPQINNIFASQKNQIDHSGLEASANVYQSIPFNSNRQEEHRPSFYQTPHSKTAVPNGSRAPPQSIPLNRRPPTAARKIYPLGNPRNPTVKSRPEFFKPQPRPPIYKIRPHKLEGVFGPALPPKPEPTRIRLPNDYSIDYRDQQRSSVTPTPQQIEDIYGRNAYEEDYGYIHKPPLRQSYRTNYQGQRQPPRSVRRGDFGITDRIDVTARDVVYKSVRDMDYSRPQVILHVKDSGELYVPDPNSAHMPLYDKSPRVEITPGHGTLEQYLSRKKKEEENQRLEKLWQDKLAIQRQKDLANQRRAEAERTRRSTTQITTSTTAITTTISPEAWLADFSDSMPDDMKNKSDIQHNKPPPNRSTNIQSVRDSLYRFQPLDLESEPSEVVVFRDTDIHRSQSPNNSPSSNGFKFPNNPKKQERRPSLVRQFRDVSKSSAKSNANKQRDQLHSTHNPNNVPHIIRKVNRKRNPTVEKEAGTSKVPNYNVVIGLSYDDNEPNEEENDYDFEENNTPVETLPETEYSRGELYQICIFEVPEYLKTQLCGGILEGRSQQFINRRSDPGHKNQGFDLKKEETKKIQKNDNIKTVSPVVSVVIPPRPSQLLHGQENVQSISYNIVNTANNDVSHLIGTTSQDTLKKLKGIFLDKLITNNLERNQQHPPPIVITANSKVKTYGPIPQPALEFSVSTPVISSKETVEPIVATTTTHTPWKIIPLSTVPSSPVSPATYTAHSPTLSPIHYKRIKTVSPGFGKRPVTVVPQGYSQSRRRPLRFRKRNKQTGTVQASKPFEYFSRLAQHLGSRLQTPPPQHRRRSTTTPPSIVRQRIRNDT